MINYSYDVYFKKERADGVYIGLVDEFSSIDDAFSLRDRMNRESFDEGLYHITYFVLVERIENDH